MFAGKASSLPGESVGEKKTVFPSPLGLEVMLGTAVAILLHPHHRWTSKDWKEPGALDP